MAKYILNIPDEILEFMNDKFDVLIEPEVKVGECRHYKVRLDDTEITPYTEPDEDEIKQKVEDEVWEFVRRILGMNEDKYCECFDIDDIAEDDFACKYTYQEAKAKYDAWKKQKEEIKVGDEVKYFGDNCVVVYVGADEVYHLIDENWIREVVQGKYKLTKTGRHFNEVDELLKKMKGE